MDCEKQYFYLTIHHIYPDYSQTFTHLHDDIYQHIDTGELFRKRLLCDYGWGQESGYIAWPEPTFEELITLVTYVPQSLRRNPFFLLSKKQGELYRSCSYNAEGAVCVIMQDHLDEFIVFLKNRVNTNYFDKHHIRKQFRLFSFDRQLARKWGHKYGRTVGSKSYADLFAEHPGWAEISEQVIKAVYRW